MPSHCSVCAQCQSLCQRAHMEVFFFTLGSRLLSLFLRRSVWRSMCIHRSSPLDRCLGNSSWLLRSESRVADTMLRRCRASPERGRHPYLDSLCTTEMWCRRDSPE